MDYAIITPAHSIPVHFQSHTCFLCLKMAESTCAAKPKRKRTVLSIKDKGAIIKQLEISSANVIAERKWKEPCLGYHEES